MTAATDYTTAYMAGANVLGPLSWVAEDVWDAHDPWGSTIGVMFVLNDVLADVGGETNPTFRQAMAGADDEAHGYVELIEAIESGAVSIGELELAERILDELDERLRADGRSY